MLELCHELRLPFVSWIVANQVLSPKLLSEVGDIF